MKDVSKLETNNKNIIKNGYKKEFANGLLIFDGNYLNGKKHGKVKEYSEGKLIFEGKYS